MILTDTHTHLYYEENSAKRAALIQRSIERDVKRLFLPNVNTESVALILDLLSDYTDNCFPMLGLHPCEVGDSYLEDLDSIRRLFLKTKIYAIGEIGIDLYWEKTTLKIQEEAFIYQIELAIELDLPIVIHCREAFDEVYTVLRSLEGEKLRGIFHCFTGTKEQADKIIDLGFYLGIGGVLTYKNSGLDKVVQQLDLEHIVLETDSPYLTPMPFRGKPNESSYLIYIAEKIAALKNVTLADVAEITTNNSKLIFGV